MYARGAELKVGLVVVAGSVALLGLLYFATGESLWADWRHVHLRLESGDLAPRSGDPVFIAGVEVGRISEVHLHTDPRSVSELSADARKVIEAEAEAAGTPVPERVRETWVHAVAKLRADQTLPVGTVGMITQSVTGFRTLTLVMGPSLTDLRDEDTAESPILIRQAPTLGGLSDQIGSMMEEVGTAVGTANGALEDIRGLVGSIREQVEGGHIEAILTDIREAAASIRRTAGQVEEDAGPLAGKLVAAAEDIEKGAAAVARLATQLEEEVPLLVSDVREVAAKLVEVVDRVSPKVDAFLTDIQRTGQNLVALSEEFAGVGPEARRLLSAVGRDVEDLVETLTDTGRNLLDASEDLRAHPWKLLNRPPAEEIAHENLRNAMQNYVRALQHMNVTARTLKDLLATGQVRSAAVQGLVRRTLAEFESSMDRYRATERRLLELLQAGAPPAAAPSPPAPPPRPR